MSKSTCAVREAANRSETVPISSARRPAAKAPRSLRPTFVGLALSTLALPSLAQTPPASAPPPTQQLPALPVGADRLLARPFDYGDAESRLLQLGTVAGAVVGLVVPVLAESDNPALIFGPATLGGIVGAVVTHNLIGPAHANARVSRRTGARGTPSRFTVRFTPQNFVLAKTGREGVYPVLNVAF